MPNPTIQQALAAVMADVREVRKTERNTGMNFNFRGIDAVLNACGPALRAHNVVVMPSVVEHTIVPTSTAGGKASFHVVVLVDYIFTGPAGDSLTARVLGEAMDYGDKAVPKAMSVAFRTALLQALALPTDDPDPDAQSYERAAPSVESLLQQIQRAGTVRELKAAAEAVRSASGGLDPASRQALLDAYTARQQEVV